MQAIIDFIKKLFGTKPTTPKAEPQAVMKNIPKDTTPPWLTEGLKDIGFHEIGNNRGIEKFITQAHTGHIGDQWCAIWVNAKLESTGFPGTRSPSSQSFRNNPNLIKLKGPALGAVAVYWRTKPTSGTGHVGFYLGETAAKVLTLGGNQSDSVKKQFEPKARLWGYWWPKNYPLPTVGVIKVSTNAATPGKVT